VSRFRHSCQDSDSLAFVKCRYGSGQPYLRLDVQCLRLVTAMHMQVRRQWCWHVGREMEYVVRTRPNRCPDLPSLATAAVLSWFGPRKNYGEPHVAMIGIDAT
jgi:hypothetical protein